MRNDKAGIPMLPDLRVADVVASFLCCHYGFNKISHFTAKMSITRNKQWEDLVLVSNKIAPLLNGLTVSESKLVLSHLGQELNDNSIVDFDPCPLK